MFSFCSLFSNFDRWRGIQEHMACGSELETQDAKSIVLDIRCDLSDREHLSHQEAGGRGGVSCDTTRKTLGGNANGMTKKKKQHRPNDLHLPWPVSKHSVVQLSHHQVLFPQHNKVRTWRSQWQQQKKPPTVLKENNDLAKHTKNKGNFQVTPMKPFLGGGKTSRFVSVLFSGPPCPWNKKTFMRNMDNYHCGQAY